MIAARTVLILGAGASVPYGLPTGCGLSDIIRATHLIDARELSPLNVNPREFQKFREALDNAGRISVDTFLEARPELVDVGKLAIALALLPREQAHAMFGDWPQRRLGQVKDTAQENGGHWYELLFNMLTAGREFEDVDFTDLSIVTFNYDRSLEHYLFTTLLNAYGRSPEETAARLGTMQIVHVHGSLGRLPWQPGGDTPPVPYGDKSPSNSLHARDSIKVLHETQDDSPEFKTAHALIAQAQKVYLFGFGFHPTNLLRLGLTDMLPNGLVGGTTRHLSYDTIQKTRDFRFFKDHPLRNSPRWQEKDIYDYLYDHVSFDV